LSYAPVFEEKVQKGRCHCSIGKLIVGACRHTGYRLKSESTHFSSSTA